MMIRKKELNEKLGILEYLIHRLEYDIKEQEKNIESLEKNTKALFEEYVIGANNLVCPVCGDKVHIVIDDRFKSVFASPHIENNGTFVYKIKCNNHCVGVRDENILSAINKFKSLKVGDEDEEAGTTL